MPISRQAKGPGTENQPWAISNYKLTFLLAGPRRVGNGRLAEGTDGPPPPICKLKISGPPPSKTPRKEQKWRQAEKKNTYAAHPRWGEADRKGQWCQIGSHAASLLFLQRKSPTCFNVSVHVYCASRGKKRRYVASTRLSGLFAHVSSICNCSSPCGPHNEISMTPEQQFETWQT